MQNRFTGSRSARWGTETAARIARLRGIRMTGPGNEGDCDGRKYSIKCLRSTTGTMNVYESTRERVDVLVAVLEQSDGSFDLHEVTPEWVRAQSRPVTSGDGRGRAVKIARAAFATTARTHRFSADEVARA